ncbi:MAG: DUF4886 domain-containing protein [Roseburia sp.]|nr:DUF4886 domain-containing protein [Roseburia sp.]MCM1099458.1 DUF4886 domain-containing protein [Ruminococcus flavefaciens]
MISILAIGNSFSQDATHFLHQLAEADHVETRVVNLYIGGCSLERHWYNISTDGAEYLYELNGRSQERHVSVGEALAEGKWDYIVTQQASHDSGWPETYEPFLGNIIGYLRERSPEAQILLQETWAYETDSTHSKFIRYHNSQREMYERLRFAYQAASERTGLPLIPCGEVIQTLREKEPFRYGEGGMSLCRDGFHMSYLYGRYALAATWYKAITGRSLKGNAYVPELAFPSGEAARPELLELIRQVVEETVPGTEMPGVG